VCSLWTGSRSAKDYQGPEGNEVHEGNGCSEKEPIPQLSGLVKEVLSRLAAILPKDHERDLRLSQEQTQIILDLLKNVECILKARGKGIAVLVALGLVCAALVLMKNWQGWIIRNGITAACAVTLVGQTCPFRVAVGVGWYLLRPGRHLRSLHAEEHVANDEEKATISTRDVAKLTLQRRGTTFGEKLLGVAKTSGLLPHELEDANGGWLDHCEVCGAYICGSSKTCRVCGYRLCLGCANENIPQCTGKLRKQRKQQVPGSAWLCSTTPDMKLCSLEWSEQRPDP